MSTQDVPGFCLICGGENNGLYTRGDRLYRRSGATMYDAETGTPYAGERKRPIGQVDNPPPKRTPEDVKAGREKGKKKAEPKPQLTTESVDKVDANDPQARVDALLADYSPLEIASLLTEVKTDLDKAGTENDIEVDLADSEEAALANAKAIVKYTEA